MLNNSATSWGSVARVLHWLIAGLIAVQLPLGWFAQRMEDSPAKITWMTTHKSLGVTVLILMLARLFWRLCQPRPLPAPDLPRWQKGLAGATHWALYGAVLSQTAIGWVIADTSRIPWRWWWTVSLPDWIDPNVGLNEFAEEAHEVLAWILVALIGIHIAAALWHHFVRRDELLRRMWSG